MLITTTIAELRNKINEWRLEKLSIALVPTMGNLHDGHLTLVTEAQKYADRVVVSIFVNPTQFCEGEDYETYPRTESEDRAKLSAIGTDLIFHPTVSEIYQADSLTSVTVNKLSDRYCGAHRPGHFTGVTTIVCKLFNIVQPDLAVFGLKDLQQFTIIRTMVRDLNLPVNLFGVETVRETNGLAMSSRNNYLTDSEKLTASKLYQSLNIAKDAINAGQGSFEDIEHNALSFLQKAGFQPDYFSICRAGDLCKATPDDTELAILVAARLNNTRLIDNIRFSKSEDSLTN